jgi:hypothetical protein
LKPETFEQQRVRHNRMLDTLEPLGWIACGMMTFFKGGKIYDLSAADISQIDRIEREGLFVIDG